MKTRDVKKLVVCVLMIAVVVVVIACAPVSNEVGQAIDQDSDQEPIEIAWSMESDCVTCHAAESASMADSVNTASIHKDQDLSCIDCHTSEADLAKAHDGVTSDSTNPTKLKRSKVENDICLACHDEAELVDMTMGSTALTDINGKTVNPHALPDTRDHADAKCSNCHDMHSGASDEEKAMEYCIDCHHTRLFECKTCHA